MDYFAVARRRFEEEPHARRVRTRRDIALHAVEQHGDIDGAARQWNGRLKRVQPVEKSLNIARPLSARQRFHGLA